MGKSGRGRTVSWVLHDQSSEGNGLVMDLAGDFDVVVVYVFWTSSHFAGDVIVESAETSTYTGTWKQQAISSFDVLSPWLKILKVNAKGLKFMRARLDSITFDPITVKATASL